MSDISRLFSIPSSHRIYFLTFFWSLALQQRHHFRALLTRAPNLVYVHYCGGGSSGFPTGPSPPGALLLCPNIRARTASAAPPGLCLLVIPRRGSATSPVGLSGRAPRPALHSQRGECDPGASSWQSRSPSFVRAGERPQDPKDLAAGREARRAGPEVAIPTPNPIAVPLRVWMEPVGPLRQTGCDALRGPGWEIPSAPGSSEKDHSRLFLGG